MEFLRVMLYTYIRGHKEMLMTLLRRKEDYSAAHKEHATRVKRNIHVEKESVWRDLPQILSVFISRS